MVNPCWPRVEFCVSCVCVREDAEWRCARASVCAVEEIAHFKNTDSNPAPFKPALSLTNTSNRSISLPHSQLPARSGEAWRQIARRARRQVRCRRHNYLRPILTTGAILTQRHGTRVRVGKGR